MRSSDFRWKHAIRVTVDDNVIQAAQRYLRTTFVAPDQTQPVWVLNGQRCAVRAGTFRRAGHCARRRCTMCVTARLLRAGVPGAGPLHLMDSSDIEPHGYADGESGRAAQCWVLTARTGKKRRTIPELEHRHAHDGDCAGRA
ncbi:MAG: hypothetical protein U0694_03810 [Anaerolineae bacterium]